MAHMYVDIDLADVDDYELIDELRDRGYKVAESDEAMHNELLAQIYLLRRTGKTYDHLVDKLIYEVLGKVI